MAFCQLFFTQHTHMFFFAISSETDILVLTYLLKVFLPRDAL